MFKKLLIAMLVAPHMTFADPKVDKGAEIFIEKYAEEKIKEQLENFLNAHPEVLFAPSAEELGTETMKYVGALLSVHSFITADTDKQKLFAALGLANALYTVPYVGMALLASQLVDLAVSLEHQKQLAETYKEIKRLEMETIEEWRDILTAQAEGEIQIISDCLDNLKAINEQHAEFKKDRVLLYLRNENSAPPSEEEVSATFARLIKFRQLWSEYEMNRFLFDQIVEIKEIKGINIQETFTTYEAASKPLIESLQNIIETVRKVLIAASTQKSMGKIKKLELEQKTRFNRYIRCSDAVNQALSYDRQSPEPADEDWEAQLIIERCIEHYSWEAFND